MLRRRPLRSLTLCAVAALGACGDRNGPLDPAGVWRYGVAPADTRRVDATVGDAAAAPVPVAAAPAPVAPTPVRPPPPAPATPSVPAGAYRVVPVTDGGTVRVRCRLRAAVPLWNVPVTKHLDLGCGPHAEMPTERLVYDETSLGVANCLVRLRGITQGKDWPEALRGDERALVIDQRGCVYVPHLAVARPGTQVNFKNSDRADHNIRGSRNSFAETVFNFSNAPGTTTDSTESYLDRPGVYILKCDIHPWMSGHVVTVDTPYFDKTYAVLDPALGKAPGEAVLTDVPPGEYEVVMWHEGTVETVNGVVSVTYSPHFEEVRPVAVRAGETTTVEIVFDPR